jgi:hypothetical protein
MKNSKWTVVAKTKEECEKLHRRMKRKMERGLPARFRYLSRSFGKQTKSLPDTYFNLKLKCFAGGDHKIHCGAVPMMLTNACGKWCRSGTCHCAGTARLYIEELRRC